MTDEDIRSNKELAREEHLKAKELLASLYGSTTRIGEALQYHGANLLAVPSSETLPTFEEKGPTRRNSLDGIRPDYLQGLVDEIAKARADVARLERELARLHVEFVPFGLWP